MSVPVGRRTQSRFEASHHFYKLRGEITTLVMNDFGFRPDKQEKSMAHYQETHKNAVNLEEVLDRWQTKTESFTRWFIDEEGKAVLDIMRNIEREFTIGNSIYPSETPARMLEFYERRKHMDNAIGLCYALKQEINYIIRTLPVDLNKFEHFAKEIDTQIALYKGVRKSDNRLLKPQKEIKPDTLEHHTQKIFSEISDVIYKIGELKRIGI